MRTTLAIMGILLFVVVASVGVMIAQRQQQISGPVAPNVPSSTPAASTDESKSAPGQCFVEFTVDAPDGIANCVKKLAFNGVPGATGVQRIIENRRLDRGTEFFYQVTVRSPKLTSGNVTFSDQLPSTVTLVEDAANTTGLIYDAEKNTVTKSLGQLQPAQEVKIVFKVKLSDDAALGQFTNTASVATEGSGQSAPVQCSTTQRVMPEGKAVCEAKTAYTLKDGDTPDQELAAGDDVSPGDEFMYRISVVVNEPTLHDVVVVDTLPSNVKFVREITEGLTHENGVVTASVDSFTYPPAGDEIVLSRTFEFVVAVKDDAAPGKFDNTVSVVNGEDTADASQCSLELNVASSQCNAACTTNDQCPTNHSCVNDLCRLTSNPGDDQCRPATTPTPTPTPTVGCNQACATNADCSDPDHICYSVDGTNKCRLADEPTSLNCTETVAGATPTPQPELPDELPETGWSEMSNWLKAGLVTIGIGAALLLLL
jgi:fimbrial isopeptide formation D2 family protein